MASGVSSSSSNEFGIDFPVSEGGSRTQPILHQRPYLPFRRISLPAAPTLLHRDSVVSVASFDSLPENEAAPLSSSPPVAMRNSKVGKGRPTPLDAHHKKNRRRDNSTRHADETRERKRQKVVDEFYETEKAYVDGLELIYSHFLSPIIASLDTPQPLLERPALTEIFSNFIDIWNLHRSFFSSLTTHLYPSTSSHSVTSNTNNPPLSPILLSHFPYLSLYNPFVTAFPSMIAALTQRVTPPTTSHPNALYNHTFAKFLSAQEADPKCGRLKLRDWLLTVVQRCPRYLLLLKDLISCTDSADPEYTQLTAVHTLVSKITLSLNTSLHTHAQTLSLLALQRATPNLPFQLIVPGRNLLKRGLLSQVERSNAPHEREFLLFSDCLIWLAPDDEDRGWAIPWGVSPRDSSQPSTPLESSPLRRPALIRSRSKSEAELSSLLKPRGDGFPDSVPSTPQKPQRKSYYHHPSPSPSSATKSLGGRHEEEARWVYKGRAELVDIEVVVASAREEGEERRLEVLNPEGSFVLYAGSESERDEWTSAIRQAKAQQLISLNITQPNSTLTSSAATNHVRRSLQALPFPPSDDRIATMRVKSKSSLKKNSGFDGSDSRAKERRSKVEHWVPAIWIPDEKTDACMRCGRSFGWRRRRHHCRLCGRCVCAACSGRTFFIADKNSKNEGTKAARACESCYESVFPIVKQPSSPTNSGLPKISQANLNDTITSLSNLPSWLSSHPPGRSQHHQNQPQALMAIDISREASSEDDERGIGLAEGRRARMRLKSPSRPKSYHQILEDFQDEDRAKEQFAGNELQSQMEEEEEAEEVDEDDIFWLSSSPSSSQLPKKREDTARRMKRFSLPAVALQTTSVMARTAVAGDGGNSQLHAEGKRFSLGPAGPNYSASGVVGRREETSGEVDGTNVDSGLGKGVAASKLSELLGRKTREGA